MHSLNVDNALAIAILNRRTNLRQILRRSSLTQNQGLHLHRKEHSNKDQQHTNSQGAERIPQAITGQQGQTHAKERKNQTQQRTRVLQQKHRKLRVLRSTQETHPALLALQITRLLHRHAERITLQQDRTHQNSHRNPLPLSNTVRVMQLLITLIQSEQATQGKDNNRNNKRVNIAVTAITKRMFLISLLLRSATAQKKQKLITRVSHRVNSLRQHRRRTSQRKSQKLQHRNTQVRTQRSNNRARTRMTRRSRHNFPFSALN